MSRRVLLKPLLGTVLLLPCLAQAQQSPAPPANQPNILVIWGDDIGTWNVSHNSRGMMGYMTPNIDRIAREGISFTDYYVQQSCTAGRAAFIANDKPRIRRSITQRDELEAASGIRVDLGGEGFVTAIAARLVLGADVAADHDLLAAFQRPLAGLHRPEFGGVRIPQVLADAGGREVEMFGEGLDGAVAVAAEVVQDLLAGGLHRLVPFRQSQLLL